MNKKLWMTLGTATLAASSVVAVVSCGTSNKADKNSANTQQATAGSTVTTGTRTGSTTHTASTGSTSQSDEDKISEEEKAMQFEIKSVANLAPIKEETNPDWEQIDFSSFGGVSEDTLKDQNELTASLVKNDGTIILPHKNFTLRNTPFLEGSSQLHVEKSKLISESLKNEFNKQDLDRTTWYSLYSKANVGAVDAYQSAAWHNTYTRYIGTKGRTGIGFRYTQLNLPARFESDSNIGGEATWAKETQPRMVAHPKYNKVRVQLLELKDIVSKFKEAQKLAKSTWTGASKVSYTNTSYGIAKAAAALIGNANLDANPAKELTIGADTPLITYINFNGHLIDLESLKNSFFNVRGYFANQKIDTLEQLIWNINTFLEITFEHPIVEGLQNITEAGEHTIDAAKSALGSTRSLSDANKYWDDVYKQNNQNSFISDLQFSNLPLTQKQVMADIVNTAMPIRGMTKGRESQYSFAFEQKTYGQWINIMKAVHGATNVDLTQVWHPVENKLENGKLVRRDDFHSIRTMETNMDNAAQMGSDNSKDNDDLMKKDSAMFRVAKPWKLPMFWADHNDNAKYPTFGADQKITIASATSQETKDAETLLALNSANPAEKLLDYHGSSWSINLAYEGYNEQTHLLFRTKDEQDSGIDVDGHKVHEFYWEPQGEIGTFWKLNLAAFLDKMNLEAVKKFVEDNKAAGRTNLRLTNQLSNPIEAMQQKSGILLGSINPEDQYRLMTPGISALQHLKFEDTPNGHAIAEKLNAEAALGRVREPQNVFYQQAKVDERIANQARRYNEQLPMTIDHESAQAMQMVQEGVAGAQVYATFYLEAF